MRSSYTKSVLKLPQIMAVKTRRIQFVVISMKEVGITNALGLILYVPSSALITCFGLFPLSLARIRRFVMEEVLPLSRS
jgi:hypothetical protein